MKASEAILILKGLNPDHEVRLDIGVLGKQKDREYNPAPYYNTYGQPVWVDRTWPIPKPDYKIYCKASETMQ